MANGSAEFGAEQPALKLYDEALPVTATQDDLGMPPLTIAGRRVRWRKFGHTDQARLLIRQALTAAQPVANLGYESDLYLDLGNIERS
jgi:hypothetical protein